MKRNNEVAYQNAIRCFDEIKAAVPNLESNFTDQNTDIELLTVFPVQDGLKFEVSLNFQALDELHLTAGYFWFSWFPCSDEEKIKAFRDAVIGILTGELRIVEYYKGKQAFKAELQRLDRNEWKVLATRKTWFLSFSKEKSEKILQNIF